MRDDRIVFTLAAVVNKRLGIEVCIMQSERHTEFNHDGRGYAVGPYITSHPLKELADKITRHLK